MARLVRHPRFERDRPGRTPDSEPHLPGPRRAVVARGPRRTVRPCRPARRPPTLTVLRVPGDAGDDEHARTGELSAVQGGPRRARCRTRRDACPPDHGRHAREPRLAGGAQLPRHGKHVHHQQAACDLPADDGGRLQRGASGAQLPRVQPDAGAAGDQPLLRHRRPAGRADWSIGRGRLAMRLSVRAADVGYSYETRRLARRLVSPMCGLDQGVGFLMRGRLEPRFVVAGAELTGAYLLAAHAEPASYHIGGTGMTLDEALIRTLGETVERYSQVVSAVAGGHSTLVASHRELKEAGRPTVPADRLRFFTPREYAEPEFPFQPFDEDAPLTWVRTSSLLDGDAFWAPAQLLIVGYAPRRGAGEPWLLPAVSTGTAAHTDESLAVRNALLELIQIDAAMGHWYSAA